MFFQDSASPGSKTKVTVDENFDAFKSGPKSAIEDFTGISHWACFNNLGLLILAFLFALFLLRIFERTSNRTLSVKQRALFIIMFTFVVSFPTFCTMI